jgi:serine-type D-Ala-D-Ala carboxypeptidase/endopeptidase
MYEFLSNYTLTRDIGEKYEYSNFGGGLLGQVLALRAGKSYEALLTERILRPLGMGSTAVRFTPAMLSRLADGHFANLTPAKNWDLDSLVGAGGIRSTTNDMLKYVAAYMGLKQSPLSAAMERAQQDLKDTTIPNMDIGLSWRLRKNADSVIVWHNGGTGGYHSYVGFDRKKGIGVVVLCNSSNSIDDIGVHLLDPRVPIWRH